jgi:hypothetical protein
VAADRRFASDWKEEQMTNKEKGRKPPTGVDPAPMQHPEKDPDDWSTGDEPMTGPQASYLKTLSQEAGEAFDEGLSKAEASKRIDVLQEKTGRGK